MQWGALSLLIAAIVMTNLTGGNKLSGSNNFLIAVCLAVFGSLTSVFATIVMEVSAIISSSSTPPPFPSPPLSHSLLSAPSSWLHFCFQNYFALQQYLCFISHSIYAVLTSTTWQAAHTCDQKQWSNRQERWNPIQYFSLPSLALGIKPINRNGQGLVRSILG